MKKVLLGLLLLGVLVLGLQAREQGGQPQSWKGLSAIHLEMGGHGVLGSLSYEYFWARNRAVRVGAFYLPDDPDNFSLYAYASHIWVQNQKNKKIYLEEGIGIGYISTRLFGHDRLSLPVLNLSVGMRYQPKPKGIVIRATLLTFYYIPWAGVSIGYIF